MLAQFLFQFQATLATLMSDTMMFSQIAQLLYQYGWNTYIGLLCGTGPYKIPLTCESAVRTLTDLQLPGLTDIEVKRQNFNEGELDSIKAAFQEVKTLARSELIA